MRNYYNILWVEEDTQTSLAELMGYLDSSLIFIVDVAENYQEAEEKINNNSKYDIIIIDIRIPKGNADVGRFSQLNIYNSQFGLDLVKYVYKNELYSMKKIFIYTNESWVDIESRLTPFGITSSSYLQKKDCRSNKHFENLILEKLSQ